MSILDVREQVNSSDTLASPDFSHLQDDYAFQAPSALDHKRLIVLVPEGTSDNMEFAHKINWLSNQKQRDVLFLALYKNENTELSMARELATLEAITRNTVYGTSSKLVNVRNWQNYLLELCRPGDMIICHAEQSVQIGRFKTIPLCDYLQDKLNVPVSTVSGFYQPAQLTLRGWGITLLFWLGLLIIIAGSTFLEIRADQLVRGFPHSILLMALLLCEMGAIWFWNKLAG